MRAAFCSMAGEPGPPLDSSGSEVLAGDFDEGGAGFVGEVAGARFEHVDEQGYGATVAQRSHGPHRTPSLKIVASCQQLPQAAEDSRKMGAGAVSAEHVESDGSQALLGVEGSLGEAGQGCWHVKQAQTHDSGKAM